MHRSSYLYAGLALTIALLTPSVRGQSVEMANDYYQHGLNDKAKDILITNVYSSSTASATKAKALYLLGQISFEEGRIKVALTDWRALVKDYPQTPEAKEIADRLVRLNEIVSKVSNDSVTSVIDSSWLPKVELASAWYDRVIQEFPGSDAAERAYERKIFALLGYKGPRSDDEAYGLKSNYEKYLPLVLDTFGSFEAAFPKNSSLQAYRYQIAQAYWDHRDWANTRLWLQKIVDKGDGQPTFYTEAAKARLQKVEY